MPRVLVIDDDPQTRYLVGEMLRAAGHEIDVAADGAQAVRSFGTHPSDLILTDIFMPEQEGIETIMQLRKLWPATPIIAMSGNPSGPTMLSIAEKLGARAILTKPFLAKELLAALDKVLGTLPPKTS
jgi:CheY-like chemotaxis protein